MVGVGTGMTSARNVAALSLLVLSTVPASPARGGGPVFYVDASAIGNDDGTSWNNAFTNLQWILPTAPVGSEIRVAGGNYRPDLNSNNRMQSFVLRNGITLLGGYGGRLQPNPDLRDPSLFVSTLNGDIGVVGPSNDNSHHVVAAINVDATAVLDGFQIRAGVADGDFPFDRGGGIYVSTASPTIVNCNINSNNSASNGGGVDVSSNSSPSFTNCILVSNVTTGNGGGLFSNGGTPLLQGCMFSNNSADVNGGGISNLSGVATVTNCTFEFNLAVISGGGFYNQNSASQVSGCDFHDNIVLNGTGTLNDGGGAILIKNGNPTIKTSLFYNNTSSDDGGAILNAGGTPTISACQFGNNIAADNGGAIFTNGGGLTLLNCVLLGNRALDFGGGVFAGATNVNIGNCTIVGNLANTSAGGIEISGNNLTLNNSILWANHDINGWIESSQITILGATFIVRYNHILGWTGLLGGGFTNSGLAPLLADADGDDNVFGTFDDDVHLLPTSPCINRADSDFHPPMTEIDFEGQPRDMGCRVDIGADEFLTGQENSGDMNGDGAVNGLDIGLFTQAQIGTAPLALFCVADIDGDLFLDDTDFNMFLVIVLGP